MPPQADPSLPVKLHGHIKTHSANQSHLSRLSISPVRGLWWCSCSQYRPPTCSPTACWAGRRLAEALAAPGDPGAFMVPGAVAIFGRMPLSHARLDRRPASTVILATGLGCGAVEQT